MEEREPSVACSSQHDQCCVSELEEFGKVEHIGPEEEGPTWRGLIGWEAEDPTAVGHHGEGGEDAPNGHEEGEEDEEEVVDGGDQAESGGAWGWEWRVEEDVGEGEVGEDCEGEEERGGAKCMPFFPLELADSWVVHQPVVDLGVKAVHRMSSYKKYSMCTN